MVSAMTVVLEGGFPASSAVIRLGLIQAAADEETAAYVQVVNCGSGQVSSLEYRAELPGRTFTGTARLAARRRCDLHRGFGDGLREDPARWGEG